MPSGKIHHNAWKKASPLSLGLAICVFATGSSLTGVALVGRENVHIFSPGLLWGCGVLAGYALGYFLDPDLDIIGATSAEGRMMKIMWPFGALLFAWWSFYGATFRRKHRSKWTHSYVFSTVIRWAWQFWPLWGYRTPVLVHYLIGVLVGLCLSDAIHIYLDFNKTILTRYLSKE